MNTYARLGHLLSDTDSLISAQAEARGRTATVLHPGRYRLVFAGRSAARKLKKRLQFVEITGHTGTG
jgi:hypothetical protein